MRNSFYIGYFKDSKWHGKGKQYCYISGTLYEGEWENGNLNGYGVCI